jgi:hypothetical protein
MLKLVNRNSKTKNNIKLTPQAKIEHELSSIINLGNWECAYLFSSEGLLLAGVKGQSDFDQNQAIEIVYAVNDAIHFLDHSSIFSGMNEILMVSQSRRKISVRTFDAFQQKVSLVLVVPKGKTYRSHTNRLISKIKKIGQSKVE